MLKILVTYGTLTGNTEIVAESLHKYLTDNASRLGVTSTLLNNYEVNPQELKDYDLMVIGASTWGDDEANPVTDDFVLRLENEAADLKGLKVAIFGLGEVIYPVFCGAVDMLDKKMQQFGAEIVGEHHKIDGYPDDEVLTAANNWLEGVLSSLLI